MLCKNYLLQREYDELETLFGMISKSLGIYTQISRTYYVLFHEYFNILEDGEHVYLKV